ncbi:MAG: hypothetical protein ACNY01_00335 [Desulfobacteria bacterium]
MEGSPASESAFRKSAADFPEIAQCSLLWTRSRITWQISRSDLGEIWSIRLSKTSGIAGYFKGFAAVGCFVIAALTVN